MKRMIVFFLLAAAGTLGAQESNNPAGDKAAIKQAALDYAEGFYEGNAERMERALHPLLIKRGLFPSKSSGDWYLSRMNSEMLVEITRMGRGKLDPDQRNLAFELLDMSENTASAKIFTARFNDYLHLVKENGQWRLANVLWTPPASEPTTSIEKEREAISKAIEELRLRAEAKDADGAARYLYPAVAKRTYRELVPGGKKIILELDEDVMLEMIRTGRTGPPDAPKPELKILDVYGSMASVKLSSARGGEYLHLAKLDGQWKIVNGLAF